MKNKFTILFVCTGNTCRSPMAHGIMRSLLDEARPDQVEVSSSGTSAALGFPATLYAIEASRTWGVDISDHQSQPISRQMVESADLIFAMTENHLKDVLKYKKNNVFLLKNFPDSKTSGESVNDPIGQGLDRYNETFLELREILQGQLDKILELIDEKNNAQKK